MRDIYTLRYLIFDVKGVKCPQDMTEKKTFFGAMWVAVRICKLVMESMYAHPIQWITLKILNIVSNHFLLKKSFDINIVVLS